MQSAVRICSTERTLGQVQRVGFLMDCHFIGRRTPSPTGHFLGRSFSLSVSATFLSGFLYRTQSIAKPSFFPPSPSPIAPFTQPRSSFVPLPRASAFPVSERPYSEDLPSVGLSPSGLVGRLRSSYALFKFFIERFVTIGTAGPPLCKPPA